MKHRFYLKASKRINPIFFFLFYFWAEYAIAAQKKQVPTIGEIAEKLIVGTDVVTRLMLAGCIVVGIMLIVTSLIYFRAHRQNPKFAPLDKPIFYLIFGLILLAIPFLGKIFGPTGSVLDLKKREALIKPYESIDAPLEFGNEYNH